MQIAAQLYTLRDYIKTPDQIKTSLKKVKEIGYDVIQVSGMGPIDPKELLDIVNEIGLKICVTHNSLDRIINDTDKLIEEHKSWDCEYIGLGAMPGEARNGGKALLDFLNDILPAAKKIRQSGLKFQYHNHGFEFEKIEGKNMMEIMAENTSPDEFGFLVDTFWVANGGCNPADFITKYADRIDVVHLKDLGIKEGRQIMKEVGEGNLNFPQILKACKDAGVKWLPVEQDDCNSDDPFDCLKTSLNNYNKMI